MEEGRRGWEEIAPEGVEEGGEKRKANDIQTICTCKKGVEEAPPSALTRQSHLPLLFAAIIAGKTICSSCLRQDSRHPLYYSGLRYTVPALPYNIRESSCGERHLVTPTLG